MPTLPLPEDGNGERPRRFMDPDGPDVQLACRVAQNLIIDERIRHERIAISVQDGVVILTGRADPETRELAGHTARESEGVRDVCNRVQVPDERSSAITLERRRFDDIVAELRADEHGGAQVTLRTWAPLFAALLAAVVWSVLLVAAVEFGWPIIVLVIVAGVLWLLPAQLLPAQRRRWRRGPS
ncbi:BON domain-containing protein [Catenuloplanes indicus]|uniref:BON domain-containing protein n=1 Tax=Catenuloplanes indicus TaxID=137267 RepID=A0AAE3VWR2_9ACTN|nr:BON domain-containing protein [Catenuloplanes indicus]MDQ0365141.1 hypothetical protein [Catenuloplanes indicus]